MYFRFENGIHPRETCENLLLTIHDHTSSLEDHVKLLLKRVNSLGQLLNTNNSQKKGKHKFDNKFMKETLSETIIENATNHDEKMKAKLKVNQLENELKTVALEWKSSRNIEECGCSTTFDAFNRKHHCWSCGDVLCTRCMAVHTKLPGHLSQRAVPTCKTCYQSSGISTTSP